ncbi:hypothetical protein K1T71_012933 [Dendrolimus kikuchii]|uniref:Uncharacterized protein n=1 Tax=Dendrolimus kikuchii TaxID=765133 RepID=A0ACC1CIH2_9NEOP|nr:hypothetical protein K1T71_012933 [Dendrolimus kikuchii]
MDLIVILYLLTCLQNNISATHMKKLAKTFWSEKCTKNSYVLNDCNWCKCNERYEYECKARVCSFVDMFGHFNDAIRDIDVGMEGRGVWRTSQTACEPGVRYKRHELMCICTEEGNWPNPICRDNLRFLHQIEITDKTKPSKKHKCAPTKLHLIGCNVCYCPSSGHIDPEMCTKHTCQEDDPIFDRDISSANKMGIAEEVYAQCKQNDRYKLGCQNCVCLRNNRLLCGNCTHEEEATNRNSKKQSMCSGRKINKIFKKECNLCYCREDGVIHCSVRKCLNKNNKKLKRQLTVAKADYTLVRSPFYNQDCEIGTQYKRDCNTCYCFEHDGIKIFSCTMKRCANTVTDLNANCIANTVYEMSCQICHCYIDNNIKFQACRINEQCESKKAIKQMRSNSLKTLHGYCEPFHVYKDDCNSCKCQEDGKSVLCTADLCNKVNKSVSVEIIPVKKDLGTCPKGYSYKIDCNVCFCLNNGNAICTTNNCKTLLN